MASSKIASTSSSTSGRSVSESSYAKKADTFESAPVPQTTSGAVAKGRYGVFVTDRGGRKGSYSVTSSGDSYRIINSNLTTKSGKR